MCLCVDVSGYVGVGLRLVGVRVCGSVVVSVGVVVPSFGCGVCGFWGTCVFVGVRVCGCSVVCV